MQDRKQQIIEELGNEIRQKTAGDRFTPIRQLMSRFNASQRVIEDVIDRLVAENLLVKQPNNGYFIRENGSDRRRHYRLYLPRWSSDLIQRMESYFYEFAGEYHFRCSCRSIEPEKRVLEDIEVDDCDAIIIWPPTEPLSKAALSRLFSLSVPVVLFDHEVGDLSISMVGVNNYSSGALAAAHLINKGHKSLALLVTEPHGEDLDMRSKCFLDFARYSNIKTTIIDCHVKSWERGEDVCYRAMTEYLKHHTVDFTAMFLASAAPALEIYKALADFNIKIPDDISIIAHDENSNNKFMDPPLCSVGVDFKEQVRNCITKLDELFQNELTHFHVRMEPYVIDRESVKNIK